MDKISGDDLLLYRYLAGTSDKEMRKEILKLKNPLLREVEDFITEWEAIRASNRDAGKAQAAKICLLYTSPSPRDRG